MFKYLQNFYAISTSSPVSHRGLALYMFILFESETAGGIPKLQISSSSLKDIAGLNREQVTRARLELEERGLIRYTEGRGSASPTYEILNFVYEKRTQIKTESDFVYEIRTQNEKSVHKFEYENRTQNKEPGEIVYEKRTQSEKLEHKPDFEYEKRTQTEPPQKKPLESVSNSNLELSNNLNNTNTTLGKKTRKPRPAFVAPTLEEVEEYFASKEYTAGFAGEIAEEFINHYTAVGWTIGQRSRPMADWRGAAAGWITRRKKDDKNQVKKSKNNLETADRAAEKIKTDLQNGEFGFDY